MSHHIHPERAALEALSGLPDGEPVVMLNLLRFREQASYPENSEHGACSGREAYARYGAKAVAHVAAVGGKPIWTGAAQLTVIGPTAESWDDVLLVQYPSRKAFLKMASDPDYLACTVHRTAALADSRLIAMRATKR
ncbi:MAG TPA: DUF1330 domain-containing protein [Polyangiales bacterium]|nr:DUF1330 domain-containing protein [Polyangiales bacterium]